MSERPRGIEVDHSEQETVEQKKERLRPVFERSLGIFRNPDADLRDGALSITRRSKGGEEEAISGLVAMDIADADVEFGVVEDDGEIGPSGYMGWDEIVDAKEE